MSNLHHDDAQQVFSISNNYELEGDTAQEANLHEPTRNLQTETEPSELDSVDSDAYNGRSCSSSICVAVFTVLSDAGWKLLWFSMGIIFVFGYCFLFSVLLGTFYMIKHSCSTSMLQ